MLLHCRLDGLLLPAWINAARRTIVASDSGEQFDLDRVEAAYYQVIAATSRELRYIHEFSYRLLRPQIPLPARKTTAYGSGELQAVVRFRRRRPNRS